MATRGATLEFPDGTRLSGSFSTVTDTVGADWFAEPLEPGGQELPRSAETAQPAGEQSVPPLGRPSRPEELLAVRVVVEPDYTWTGLYSPARRTLVGPIHCRTDAHVQQEYELHEGADGLEHLSQEGAREALCGHTPLGPELAFRQLPAWCAADAGNPADRRLFDEWDDALVCRDCLTRPEILGYF